MIGYRHARPTRRPPYRPIERISQIANRPPPSGRCFQRALMLRRSRRWRAARRRLRAICGSASGAHQWNLDTAQEVICFYPGTLIRTPDGEVAVETLKIGDLVLHRGRRYYLRGLDPMSVPDRQAFLEDALTGEARMVPVDEIEPVPPPLHGV